MTVEDNGPGIASEILPTLFQRYTRAPQQAATRGGTGLGLLIVREIVEAHGGTVGVESALGRAAASGSACRPSKRPPRASPRHRRRRCPAAEPRRARYEVVICNAPQSPARAVRARRAAILRGISRG